MNSILLVTLMGLTGGAVRAIAGLIKHGVLVKKEKFDAIRFFTTLAVAAVIGAFTAVITAESWKLALLAGYAGTDLLDAILKTISGKKET